MTMMMKNCARPRMGIGECERQKAKVNTKYPNLVFDRVRQLTSLAHLGAA